eukprot:scaffold141165_cov30-Tisochrysis_lutea.AAC.4
MSTPDEFCDAHGGAQEGFAQSSTPSSRATPVSRIAVMIVCKIPLEFPVWSCLPDKTTTPVDC